MHKELQRPCHTSYVYLGHVRCIALLICVCNAHLYWWNSAGNKAIDFYLGRDKISVFKHNIWPPLWVFILQKNSSNMYCFMVWHESFIQFWRDGLLTCQSWLLRSLLTSVKHFIPCFWVFLMQECMWECACEILINLLNWFFRLGDVRFVRLWSL